MTRDHDPVPPVNHGTADARRGPASRLAAVIENLERATAGSAELDAEIAAAFRLIPSDAPNWLTLWRGEFRARNGRVHATHSDGKEGAHWAPNKYTRSLDAALSLVPDTTDFVIRRTWCVSRSARITNGADVWYGEATTEALALCIAALKARLSSLPGESDAAGERSSLGAG